MGRGLGRRATARRRAIVSGITAIGLGLYAVAGTGKGVMPFQGKATSTPASDAFSAAAVTEGGGLYNKKSTGNVDAVSVGPNQSLYFYWQIGGSWFGPVQIGAPGTSFSGPAITDEGVTPDHLDVAVEGPNHTLNFFWYTGGTWYGPLRIGAPGSTWSKPAIVFDQNGNVDVSAQGPNGSLYDYWAINGAWSGPFQVNHAGMVFSAPAMATTLAGTSGNGCRLNVVYINAEGPGHESIVYADVTTKQPSTCTPTAGWQAPSVSGLSQQYSAANGYAFSTTAVFTSSTTLNEPIDIFDYQGPGGTNVYQWSNALIFDFLNLFGVPQLPGNGQGGSNSFCVLDGFQTNFTAPGIGTILLGTGSSGEGTLPIAQNVAQGGPSNSLYASWVTSNAQPTSCQSFNGPLQLNGAGTTFSVPAVTSQQDNTGSSVTNVLVEGPSHTLWLYWNSGGVWNGPLQLGNTGTTFDSSN